MKDKELVMTNYISGLKIAALSLFSNMASQSGAYPIDCAILLCLGGGFPASAECQAAKAVMVQRVTSLPTQPPVQPWNCPIGLSGKVIEGAGTYDGRDLPAPQPNPLSRLGLDYLRRLTVTQVDIDIGKDETGCSISSQSRIGRYTAEGDFLWQKLPVPAMQCGHGTAGRIRHVTLQYPSATGALVSERFSY